MPPVYVVHRKDDTVRLDRLAPAGIRILSAIDQAAMMCQTHLLITCGSEGHAAGDPHSRGEALDVRAANLDPALIVRLYNTLARLLGSAFTVLYEVPTKPVDPVLRQIAYVNHDASAPHFHLQPLKGTTWPPVDAPVRETVTV